MPKIEIKTDGVTGRIFVDGEQLKGVVGYKVEHTARELPIVTVEFLPTELEIDAPDAVLVDATSMSDDARRLAMVAPLPGSGGL